VAPNSSINKKDILTEATKLKLLLVGVQNEVEKISDEAEKRLMEAAKAKLDYELPEKTADKSLIDSRVAGKTTVLSPHLLISVLPVSTTSADTTHTSRSAIESILKHDDKRILAVVGPCSIHDPKAALEYAEQTKKWREKFGEDLEIVMRTYIEKPRTELGWKGFIYDPLLNESDDINLGLIATRMLACQITDMGVPIAVERLNALTPQYLNALVAYDVIGARNTTDQKAREYASATSSPVGFKNTPEGSIEVAAQAVVSAKGKHAFLGIGTHGATKQINSAGNDTGHIILRGDAAGPNYSEKYIAATKELLAGKGLLQSIVVDASHGNSGKQAKNQILAIQSVCDQVAGGEEAIVGVMIESNLVSGCQKLGDPAKLVYGQSITDDCVGVAETEHMLELLAEASRKRRSAK
jgi:3-deoxy-7-phosphoheptulonate synthase